MVRVPLKEKVSSQKGSLPSRSYLKTRGIQLSLGDGGGFAARPGENQQVFNSTSGEAAWTTKTSAYSQDSLQGHSMALRTSKHAKERPRVKKGIRVSVCLFICLSLCSPWMEKRPSSREQYLHCITSACDSLIFQFLPATALFRLEIFTNLGVHLFLVVAVIFV